MCDELITVRERHVILANHLSDKVTNFCNQKQLGIVTFIIFQNEFGRLLIISKVN